MSTMSALTMLGLILLVLGVYWLPSILARSWRHPDLVSIVIVNALLGWTVVGWVWAIGRLVGGRADRLQLAPATVTAAGGEQPAWQRDTLTMRSQGDPASQGASSGM
ncbi:MAG: superinfection immunity protein [Streptosporangiaceae bacterium]